MRKTIQTVLLAVSLIMSLLLIPASADAVSSKTVRFVAKYEGFLKCPSSALDGYPTVGYGHVLQRGEKHKCWSKSKAKKVLKKDLAYSERAIRSKLYSRTRINGKMMTALTSFVFNVGPGKFGRTSPPRPTNIAYHVSVGNHKTAMRQLKLFVNSGGRPLPGLKKRRAAEASMYMSGARKLR